MSKSVSSYLIPGLGVMAGVLGVSVGMANRDYGGSEIETLNARVSELSVQAEEARETAAAETTRAAEIEASIADIQERARLAAANSSGTLSEPAPAKDGGYGLGRAALPEEVAAWNLDVGPNAEGLPEGSGDVFTGEEVFAEKCASCHGDFAEGVGNWPKLAGGFDTLDDKDPVKTVGSFWPYLSTVWDYVHRSMPFGQAQTLTVDEVYAITAYILYSNDLVDDDFELSHENFLDVEMYNTGNFILDDREESEYAIWRAEPCMENCKSEVKITMRASVLDVTPDVAGEEDDPDMADSGSDEGQAPVAVAAALDPALVEAGAKVFRKCKACHEVGEGAKNKVGPTLNGLLGRPFAAVEDYKYSNAFKAAADEGRVWDETEFAAFLANPKQYVSGTKMSFAGLKKEDEIAAVLAYLQAESE